MTEINLKELSEIILDRYTPFCFKCECECNGQHSECAEARIEMYQQFETVQRIAKYISEFNPEHQEKNKMILKEFIGTKCFACNDEMNFDYPAFYPTWSDFYDNIICEDCDNKNKRSGF